tara:strand:- start:1137 stop:3395 length:2259 start_codon:yes stop_codon:yes gene_type:complete
MSDFFKNAQTNEVVNSILANRKREQESITAKDVGIMILSSLPNYIANYNQATVDEKNRQKDAVTNQYQNVFAELNEEFAAADPQRKLYQRYQKPEEREFLLNELVNKKLVNSDLVQKLTAEGIDYTKTNRKDILNSINKWKENQKQLEIFALERYAESPFISTPNKASFGTKINQDLVREITKIQAQPDTIVGDIVNGLKKWWKGTPESKEYPAAVEDAELEVALQKPLTFYQRIKEKENNFKNNVFNKYNLKLPKDGNITKQYYTDVVFGAKPELADEYTKAFKKKITPTTGGATTSLGLELQYTKENNELGTLDFNAKQLNKFKIYNINGAEQNSSPINVYANDFGKIKSVIRASEEYAQTENKNLRLSTEEELDATAHRLLSHRLGEGEFGKEYKPLEDLVINSTGIAAYQNISTGLNNKDDLTMTNIINTAYLQNVRLEGTKADTIITNSLSEEFNKSLKAGYDFTKFKNVQERKADQFEDDELLDVGAKEIETATLDKKIKLMEAAQEGKVTDLGDQEVVAFERLKYLLNDNIEKPESVVFSNMEKANESDIISTSLTKKEKINYIENFESVYNPNIVDLNEIYRIAKVDDYVTEEIIEIKDIPEEVRKDIIEVSKGLDTTQSIALGLTTASLALMAVPSPYTYISGGILRVGALAAQGFRGVNLMFQARKAKIIESAGRKALGTKAKDASQYIAPVLEQVGKETIKKQITPSRILAGGAAISGVTSLLSPDSPLSVNPRSKTEDEE